MVSKAETVGMDAAPKTTFAESVTVLKQVKVSDEVRRSTWALLAKCTYNQDHVRTRKRNTLDEIKSGTRCLGCGHNGHWFRDKKKGWPRADASEVGNESENRDHEKRRE